MYSNSIQNPPFPPPSISQSQIAKPVYQPQRPLNYENENYQQPHVFEIQQPNQNLRQSHIVVENRPANTKVSYLIDWVLYFLPIAFLIIILIAMSLMVNAKIQHFNPEGAHNSIQTLKDNLLQAPIEDIKMATPRSSSISFIDYFKHNGVQCSDDYQIMIIGQWDGVKSGCLCENGELTHTFTCLYKSSCKRVNSKDPIDFHVWQEKQFCVKYYSDWVKLEGTSCGNGLKKCGNLCVPSSKQCPLSDLVRQTSSSDLQFGNAHYLKKFEDSEAVVSLQVVPGDSESSPCFNTKLNPKFQSSLYYPFALKPEIGCDQYLDLRSHRVALDSLAVNTVNNQNELNDVLNQLPFYASYVNERDTYTLEAVKKIKIESIPECQQIKPNQVETISKSSNHVYHSERYISFVILLFTGILIFFIPVLFLMRNRLFEWKDMTEFHQPRFFCSFGFVIALLCIILGGIYLYHVDGKDGLKEHNRLFNVYIEKRCFIDEGLHTAVQQVNQFAKNVYHTTYDYVLFAFYASIVYVILLFIAMIFQYSQHKSLFDNPWQYRTKNNNYYEFA